MRTTNKSWSHHHPARVHFGAGLVDQLRQFIPDGGRLLVVTSPGFANNGVLERVAAQFQDCRMTVFAQVKPNPQIDDIDAAVLRLGRLGFDHIVAIGGGSVIDFAKALSVLLPADSGISLRETLRGGVGHRWAVHIPLLAVPTTAGTGSEVTPFATVWDAERQQKLSLDDALLYPLDAVLDPALTLTLPAQLTLYTGLDAVSHACESIWNLNRNPVSEAFARQAASRLTTALPMVMQYPDVLEWRGEMQVSSLLAGLAISGTRTAIAHAISYPLTARFGVPHGLACSFTLPALFDFLTARGLLDGDDGIAPLLGFLKTLRLGAHVLRYASREAIMEAAAQVAASPRAGNFLAGADVVPFAEILGHSL